MNREHRTSQSPSTARFEAVSAEELILVEGGSLKSKFIKALKWIKDHVKVDLGKKTVTVGGKF